MTETTFSFFRGGISRTTPSGSLTMNELIDLIKDGSYRDVVTELRNLQSDEERRLFKQTSTKLDYVTIGGTFTYRARDMMMQASGLCCVDIDNLGISDAETEKKRLKSNPHIHAIFISPSGTGLKVVCKIPIDAAHYGDYFLGFTQSLGIDNSKIDKSTRDISRACFLSYDPDAYLNPESTVWATTLEPQEEWVEVGIDKDTSRSGYEFRVVVNLIRKGKSYFEICEIAKTEQGRWDDKVVAWEKWRSSNVHYREETYRKALQYVQEHPHKKELPTSFDTIDLVTALHDRRPKEWLVKGIIPKQGILYLGGAPKCYKSTIAFHTALCLATGREWFGRFPMLDGKKCVLVIQEENDFDMLEKFSLLCKGMNLSEELLQCLKNIHLSLCNGITIDTLGGREDMAISRLLDKIEQIKPDVVIFDSAVRMMEGDENAASDVRRVHNTLKALMKDRNLLSILLHHTTKAGNDLRGSGDFVAQADTVIMLNTKPEYHGQVYAKIPFNRGAPPDFNEFCFKVYSLDSNGERTANVDAIESMHIEYNTSDEEVTLLDKCKDKIREIVEEEGLTQLNKVKWKKRILAEDNGIYTNRLYSRACQGLVDEGFMAEPEGWVRGQDKIYEICKPLERYTKQDEEVV